MSLQSAWRQLMRRPVRGLPSSFGKFLTAAGVAAALLVAMMSWSLWSRGTTYIEEVSSTLVGIRLLLADDSQHYLDIADDFRNGDFSMGFVAPVGAEAADRAHRQPAYPAVLAIAEALGISGAPALARVNLLLLVLTLWTAFAVGTWVCGSALAGALAAGLIYQTEFLYDIATSRLLTEPMYVLMSTATIGAALAYLKKKRFRHLLAFATLAAVSYLTRVNGLFLAAGLAIAMVASDVHALRGGAGADADGDGDDDDTGGEDAFDDEKTTNGDGEDHDRERPLLPIARYAAAIALFVFVASPSWVPRLIYAGSPVYHGYLNNYLWVDSYEQAHLPGPPRYSWSTYWQQHSLGDAVRRLQYGISRVYWETPREKIGEGASVVAVVSILALLVARDEPALWLLFAGVLQLLPLAWTAIANNSRRIPAAALLPFLALLAAAAAARWIRIAAQRSRPPSGGADDTA